MHSLVVQHNVWQPDVVGGNMEVLDAAVVCGVPLELVVDPLLLHPHVGDHDLPLHVDPDDLRHLDPHLDRQPVRVVAHRTYQPEGREGKHGHSVVRSPRTKSKLRRPKPTEKSDIN